MHWPTGVLNGFPNKNSILITTNPALAGDDGGRAQNEASPRARCDWRTKIKNCPRIDDKTCQSNTEGGLCYLHTLVYFTHVENRFPAI